MSVVAIPTTGPRPLATQEQLLPFLLNPHSYPHRPRRVRLVQTHSSFVFIASPFVFKIKKPVNFGFLNFSTLEKRRHFCEREVALNRRLCPDLYIGVVPISVEAGRLTFGEGDEVVEYVVKMRKLADGSFLDQLVRRGDVMPGDLNRVVIALKTFYAAQEPTADIEAWGRIDRLRISSDENFRQTREFVGITLSRPAFEAVRFYTDRFYSRQRGLFASRIRERWIRDCHGDLHLEHIHLTPRALHIYDCIEFNDRFRYVDVANDAAFLAMDLDFEGRPDLACYFAGQMAAALRDEGMPRLLDFYKCYRAFVRGKVESLHSLAVPAPKAEREVSAHRAGRYFRLALQYAVAGSQPLVLAVMGRIASGKSTLARALSRELGWPVFSSDRVRKELAGFPLYQRSSAAARSRLYSASMTETTYETLLRHAAERVQRGQSVILDAMFGRPALRQLLRSGLSRRGVAWRFLEARASDRAIRRRLREREAQPEEVSDARLEDFWALTEGYVPPDELPATRLIRVATMGPASRTVLGALRGMMRAHLAAVDAEWRQADAARKTRLPRRRSVSDRRRRLPRAVSIRRARRGCRYCTPCAAIAMTRHSSPTRPGRMKGIRPATGR